MTMQRPPDPRDHIGHTWDCPRRPVVETIRAGVPTYVCQTCHATAPVHPLDAA
jgi:hypothetical protein